MNEQFPKQYQNENPEVSAYFDSLPAVVQEMIMQDNKNFETIEELEAFVDNIKE